MLFARPLGALSTLALLFLCFSSRSTAQTVTGTLYGIAYPTNYVQLINGAYSYGVFEYMWIGNHPQITILGTGANGQTTFGYNDVYTQSQENLGGTSTATTTLITEAGTLVQNSAGLFYDGSFAAETCSFGPEATAGPAVCVFGISIGGVAATVTGSITPFFTYIAALPTSTSSGSPAGTSLPSSFPTGTSLPSGSPIGASSPSGSPIGASSRSGSPIGASSPSGSPTGTSPLSGSPTGTSPSGSPTGTSPQTPVTIPISPKNQMPVGAIVGGVIGGLAVIGVVLAFLLWRRRRKYRYRMPEKDELAPEHALNPAIRLTPFMYNTANSDQSLLSDHQSAVSSTVAATPSGYTTAASAPPETGRDRRRRLKQMQDTVQQLQQNISVRDPVAESESASQQQQMALLLEEVERLRAIVARDEALPAYEQ